MASIKKDTIAINRETGCELRVTRDSNKSIGDEITLSNKLSYKIIDVKSDRIIVQYAQPFGL
jgi:hypothetical protein